MTLLNVEKSEAVAPKQTTEPGPQLRRVMRRYVTGVTVVTALDESGRLAGLTANSFTSVSLDPPLVLVCISRSSRSCASVLSAGRIAIHMLADDQGPIAKAFAERGGDRSRICEWQANERGFAVLKHYFALLECSIVDVHSAGDHAIVVARVETLEGPDKAKSPLVYHDGQMFGLGARDA